MNISKRVMGIAPSVTLEIDAQAKKLKADGLDVVGFGAGEPDFNTPRHVVAAQSRLWKRAKPDTPPLRAR